jgi:two-component sensor histidine kinase
LIVNEAVTNCFKYAFPGGGRGEISIRLWLVEDAVNLVIADDGVGMASAAFGGESNSLGVELMKGLAGDLKGTFSLRADHGVTVALCFPLDRFDVAPLETFEGVFAGI